MPIYVFESKEGDVVEETFPITSIPDTIRRDGVRYKRIPARPYGFSLPAESSPRHDAWFKSDETQRRLRLPDSDPNALRVISKSDDANHL